MSTVHVLRVKYLKKNINHGRALEEKLLILLNVSLHSKVASRRIYIRFFYAFLAKNCLL